MAKRSDSFTMKDTLLSSPLPSVGLEALEAMANRAATVVERLRARVFSPDSLKTLDLRFNVKSAAAMVGRSEKLIRDAEADGRLPPADTNPETGRRTGYTLKGVNRMRDVFNTRPWRAETDEPVVIAVQNFKGGVGKSTIVCHLAQYLALQGYRICVVDCDSQASTTSIFGLNPDIDIDEREETLYPFFRYGGPASLGFTLRATYWDGIALIPANLGLYDAEYEFAARLVRESATALDRLREGIDTIKSRFDIVLLDPPPALGMISLSVLRAADALIVPAPPNNIDFGSTGHFLRMMVSTLQEISRFGPAPDYKFVKILATKMNDSKGAHISIKRMMDHVFPHDMLAAVLKDSAEIDNATANLKTVYEITGPATRSETHKRCRAYLDAVGREVEILIRKTWPSHHPRLRSEGLL
jgi:chromosome partitioning protein